MRHNGRVGRDVADGVLVAGHGGSDVCAVDCELGEVIACFRRDGQRDGRPLVDGEGL